jgi:hypothetical protein
MSTIFINQVNTNYMSRHEEQPLSLAADNLGVERPAVHTQCRSTSAMRAIEKGL